MLALRLVDSGVSTLMLEAGEPGDPSQSASNHDAGDAHLFPVREEGDAVPSTDANRAIAVGGASARWNGVVTRVWPDDLRSGTAFGFGADWPITYDDLVPYYEAAEAALHTHGAAPVVGAEPPRAVPYPMEWSTSPTVPTVAERHATFPLAFGTRNGAPLRLREVEVPTFAASPYGTLLTGRAATRVIVDRSGCVRAVETRGRDGSVQRHSARHVVIAAGVVETARLLLLSTSSEHPHGLGNQHDQVGRFLHGHPRLRAALVDPTPVGSPSGVHRTYALGTSLRERGLGALAVDFNVGGTRGVVDVTAELEPAAEHRVALDHSWSDQWDRPGVRLTAWSTENDVRTRAAAEETLRTLTDDPVGEPALTWFHPAGTCRMAPDPSAGVVDANCTVFGVPNLHVAGAAVFPTSGPANPTLTVVALALRLADHLNALMR